MYFETIKCEDYEIFNLEYHNKRVANTIAMNLNLQEYIYPLSEELLRCKLVYDESGIIEVNYFPYNKREIKSFKLVFNDDIDYSKKYLDRSALDKLYEQKEDCDEIIIVKDGLVTDTTIANIAIKMDGVWFTPRKPLLRGTTRERFLKEGGLISKDITIEMLKSCEKLALMNAMIDFDILNDYCFKL